MNANFAKYQKILERRSIRRYNNDLLSDDNLLKLNGFLNEIETLETESNYRIKIVNHHSELENTLALGGFGLIMKAPYFFVPYIEGKTQSYVDLGFRTQQIVLELWEKGIGSCYIGCAHRIKFVKNLLGLPESSKIISLVVFGYEDKEKSERLYQKIAQFVSKPKTRFSYHELFLNENYLEFIKGNSLLLSIIKAGRFAPSATNAQPWRFEISNKQLIIYARQKKHASIYDLEQGYSLHDTGICMANMSKAAFVLGCELNWHKIQDEPQKKWNGEIYIPIAYFLLDETRSIR